MAGHRKSSIGGTMIGKGIAMAALIASATVLDIKGKETFSLWLLIFIWIIFGDWKREGR